MEVSVDYLSAGGNRHPSAAAWDSKSGLLAFGSGRNIALWSPLDEENIGISDLLVGHTDEVNAISFFPNQGHDTIILSGSVDRSLRAWSGSPEKNNFRCVYIAKGHENSINCIAIAPGSDFIVTGAADATVKVWRASVSEGRISIECIQTIKTSPNIFPLALALSRIGNQGALILAVAGTKATIQVYVSNGAGVVEFSKTAVLLGHEGWIRSLDFVHEGEFGSSDLLLASASQDKYIRLWRVHEGTALPTKLQSGTPQMVHSTALSNKVHRLQASGQSYSLTFEALLLGHEDWIYTAKWYKDFEGVRLLSASADNSVAIWNADPGSGVWIPETRLGEISAQKGSTTATGSTGGFWIGLWSPDGKSVASLGRTGSWRLWSHKAIEDRWLPQYAISGHVKDVRGVAWAKNGSYLLSTSADQTTRLHAKWKNGEKSSWHEFARPQIHGYDLVCIDTLNDAQFVSGAEEKLLRVFDEPRQVADLLQKLCGIDYGTENLPQTASMPVLGLSNKALEGKQQDDILEVLEEEDEKDAENQIAPTASITDPNSPPFEDQLARHTLWPEREKLYGHGYEISALAASHDGSLIATACKASVIDHAVIRMYETKGWREIKPPLRFHNLTVTCLRFSNDDKYLLSVSRDRQWATWSRDTTNLTTYTLHKSNSKAHPKMILGCAWLPETPSYRFATAGRDGAVKLWDNENGKDAHVMLKAGVPVITIDLHSRLINSCTLMAAGMEDGVTGIYLHNVGNTSLQASFMLDDSASLGSSLAISQVSWRPEEEKLNIRGTNKFALQNGAPSTLAIASEDNSLKIVSINVGGSKE